MNEMFKKLLAKKKSSGEEMSPGRMKARSSVLDDLVGNMEGREGKKLGMKKVSVMAPDQEGLEEGLDTAKEVLGEENQLEAGMEAAESEMEDEESEMSPEEMMAEIERLKAQLAMKD